MPESAEQQQARIAEAHRIAQESHRAAKAPSKPHWTEPTLEAVREGYSDPPSTLRSDVVMPGTIAPPKARSTACFKGDHVYCGGYYDLHTEHPKPCSCSCHELTGRSVPTTNTSNPTNITVTTQPSRAGREGDTQPLPEASNTPVMHRLVQDDLDARLRVGVERYGQPLQAFNGRNALRDAYEEVLDLAVYLRQAIWEAENPRNM